MTLFGLIAVAEAIAIRPERVLLLLALAAIGAALPLSSAIRELRHPRDAEPLNIDSNYSQEDRFFAVSFEKRVSDAIGPAPREPGPYAVVFRDPEVIDTIAGNLRIEQGRVPESIVDVHDDLIVSPGVRLSKEAIVGGNAILEEGSGVRALKSGGNIDVGRGASVDRWIDAASTIHALALSDLGTRATALISIMLDENASFRFLAAPVISASQPSDDALPPLPDTTPLVDHVGSHRHRVRADGALIVEEPFALPAKAMCHGDLIVRGDVKIGEEAVVAGSIHSDRDVFIGRGSRVTGSIVAERHVSIEPSGVVEQHVVARGRATLGCGARVGRPGSTTTLLADESVELAPNATVYGRIITYGVGRSTA